jgi:hypothetical protein
MAHAKITMPDGTSVEINGTPEEVSGVIENLQNKSNTIAPSVSPRSKGRGEIPQLIESLKAEEFFKMPRGLGEIQKRFAELGHHYPVTTLSGAMQERTRRRVLRRFKKDGKYVYVQ